MSISANDMGPADIAAVTGNNGYNNGMGWGGEWFIWIVLFAVLFGWGGNGWGGGFGCGRGSGAGVVDGYVLASDFSNIERKIDGVNNGICDGFYAMNTGMLNGFAGVNQNISNGFQAAELSRCNQQSALMQQMFQMQMANQECCCENRAAIQGVNYNMATQGCDTRNTIQNTTRDIIDAMNCGFRSLDQRDCAGAGGKGCPDRGQESAAVHGPAGRKPERPEPDHQGVRREPVRVLQPPPRARLPGAEPQLLLW